MAIWFVNVDARLGAGSPTAVAVLEITDTVGSVLQEGKVIDYSIHHS